MIYHLAADFFLVFHFLFIVFVLFGGLFTLRFRWAPAIHIPAASWGTFVEITGRLCPLTTIEVSLRRSAGDAGYSESFIEHYLYPIIYPEGLTHDLQLGFAGLVFLLNAAIYGWVIYRHQNSKRK